MSSNNQAISNSGMTKYGGDSGDTGDKPINTRGSAVPGSDQQPGTPGTNRSGCPRCPHQQKASGDKSGGLQSPKTRGVSKIVPGVPAVPTQNSHDPIKVRIESWRSLLGGLPLPDNHNGRHIGTIALHFLSSPHIAKAIKLGWDELELFGLLDSQHSIAPLRRYDAMGLVPSLALSRLGARLVKLEVERAILKTRSGSRLVYPRSMTGRRYSIVLWKHPLLRGAN